MFKYMTKEMDKKITNFNLALTLVTLIGIIILFILRNKMETNIFCICIAGIILLHFVLREIVKKCAVKKILNFEFKGNALLYIKIDEKNDDGTWKEKEYNIDEVNFYNLKLYDKSKKCEIIYITSTGDHESIIFNLLDNNKTKEFVESLKKYAEVCLTQKGKRKI